jgi:predicted DNA-binding transcriptional regulator AlpA
MAAKRKQDPIADTSEHSHRERGHRPIPEALKNFDDLPDSAHVRQPVVEGLYGCSAATVWRYVKQQRIPAPIRLPGRITAWNVGELRRALANV